MPEKDYTYIFTGKVIPEYSSQENRFSVHITDVLFPSTDGNGIVAPELNIQLKNSLLICKCKFKNEIKNPSMLMSVLKSYLHSFTDALGFEQGRAYDIDVIICFNHKNEPINFWGESLGGLCSSENRPYTSKIIVENLYPPNSEFSKTLALCYANIREAIRFPNDSPFFCYRVTENIRQFFADKFSIDEDDVNKSWGKMWEMLKYNDKKYFISLSYVSAKVRHGKSVDMSEIDQRLMFEKTYLVIDKFSEYAFAN